MSNLIVRIIAQNLAKKGFTQAAADIKRFESAVQKATQRLGRMALAAAAVSAVGLVKFASFDKKIREIGTLLGDVTEQDIKKMGLEVEKMSIRFGQSVESMAKAKYDIISAGFDGAAESAQLLDVAARLAAGGVSEVSKTADVLTSVLNAYGLSTDQAEHASDVLFTTVRLGKTTIDQLSAGLGRAVAIAPLLGLSFEELSAATAALTAQGQNTEETVTALTQVMNSLLSPQKDLADRFKEVGIQSGAASVKSIGFAETLRKITEGADEAELATYFGNIRAFRAVAPLVTTAADKFAENIVKMGNVAGATDTAFAKMEKGISFKLGQLRQVGERVLRRLGEQVAELVQGFLAMDPATQSLVLSIGALGLAFKFLGGPIGMLVGAATLFYQAWKNNVFGFRQLLEELAEDFTSTWNRLVIEISTFSKIIRDVMAGNWMLIGFDLQMMEQRTTEEMKRHADARIQIAKDFAGEYVGTLKDLIPDFAGMIGLGDINKIEEKGTETVAAVTEAVLVPINEKRMEFTAQAAEGEIKAFTGAHKLVFRSARITGMQTFQMWNRNFKSISQSGIHQIGQQISQGVGIWFKKAVGQGQTWFGQLWRAVLQQFLQMMAAMTARWLAFKALTSIFGGGIGAFFSRGGMVGQEHMPKMQRAQTGMISQGFDTVPAMLRRGEAVIPTERTRENLPAIRQIMAGQSPSARGGGGGLNITVINHISAIDSQGVEEFTSSEEFKNGIIKAIEDGKIQLSAGGLAVQGEF